MEIQIYLYLFYNYLFLTRYLIVLYNEEVNIWHTDIASHFSKLIDESDHRLK